MNAAGEIGGYLEFERFFGELFHRDAIALNCGRACLEYLIELRGIRRIWVPDWLCSSVYRVCVKCGVAVKTYAVCAEMMPAYDFKIAGDEWLYMVDYYGQLKPNDIDSALVFSEGRLIVDEAQGFFRPPWEGADTLYSCRKFFGVSDGAYLYTKDKSRIGRALERDESHPHMGFVLGRFERSASEFFDESRDNNERFAAEPMKAMSPLTENIMRAIDYGAVRSRRDENFSFLHKSLGGRNDLELIMPYGAFMYPLLVPNAGEMRRELAAAGVYIPVLWPNAVENQASGLVSRRYSLDILPLPVDQRYGLPDMERLLKEVLRCL